MTNVIERHGDNIKNAIAYVDEGLRSQPGKKSSQLISEAGSRFNLTPNDSEFLIQFFKERAEKK